MTLTFCTPLKGRHPRQIRLRWWLKGNRLEVWSDHVWIELISFATSTFILCALAMHPFTTAIHNRCFLPLMQAFRLNPDTGRRAEEAELSGLDTRFTAQLVIPKTFLDYGVYELRYTVNMLGGDDGVPFAASVSTFIQIVRYISCSKLVFWCSKLITC